MSIWCGGFGRFGRGYSDYDVEDRKGVVLSYATGWSNHYPDESGPERHAAIGLATVAPWCVPGHDQDGPDYTCTGCGKDHESGNESGAWLRMEVASWEHSFNDGGDPTGKGEGAMVSLDPTAARALGQALLDWADRRHVTPTPTTNPAAAATRAELTAEQED